MGFVLSWLLVCASVLALAGCSEPAEGNEPAPAVDGSPAAVPTADPNMPGAAADSEAGPATENTAGNGASAFGEATQASAEPSAEQVTDPLSEAPANADPAPTGNDPGTPPQDTDPVGPDPADPSTDDPAVPAGPATGPFPPVENFQESGPYGSTTMLGVGPGSNYTVYLPDELAPDGVRNPIVGWMSGGGTSHEAYPLLPHLATHGFVVMAPNVIPGIGQEAQLGQQIMDGIDWAIAETEREGSPFFEKLDTTKIASAGYSMGSLSTFMIADDARLTTTVHISGGNMVPDRVNMLHAPAAFICGQVGNGACGNILSGECDIAAANCDTDFMNATTPVFYANFNAGHLGILQAPYQQQIGAMTTAWLRYYLMADTTLHEKFVGSDCTYCTDSNFQVQQKNLD